MLVHSLTALIQHMLAELEAADRAGGLIDVRNPKCRHDCFTDRWPENAEAQRCYILDLRRFRDRLDLFASGTLSLPQMRAMLAEMFGEGPAQGAIDDLAATHGAAVRDNTRIIGGHGGLLLPGNLAAPAVLSAAPARASPHTFYGTSWQPPTKA